MIDKKDYLIPKKDWILAYDDLVNTVKDLNTVIDLSILIDYINTNNPRSNTNNLY